MDYYAKKPVLLPVAIDTHNVGAGKVVDEVSVFDDTVGTTNNYIWMDDLVIGEVVVPEPSSMLVFGTFGIAALGF